MNLIRPNRVQVLGAAELAYLESLDGSTLQAMLGHLLATRPLCLILAEGLDLPGFLAAAAEAASVPILTARANSHQVVQELIHYLSRTWGRRSSIHGVFIEVLGVGALLAGRPGVGKSELALELVSRGHRLIADDAPEFALVAPDTVEGSCPSALRDFMEVRGLGIVNVRALFGDSAVKPRRTLRLIINLVVMEARVYSPEERLEGIRGERDVLGVSIPEVSLPVAPGHNMAVLVECTIRNHILSMKGYAAADDFADRHNRIMRGEEIPER
jgi:HPr kinase/phosphorylase